MSAPQAKIRVKKGTHPVVRSKIYEQSSMATAGPQPKSMSRAKRWSEEVEEFYRFQVAGYRDVNEYRAIKNVENCDRWPHNGYVKMLQRRDGCFYYYNKERECPDKEVHKTKLYVYEED